MAKPDAFSCPVPSVAPSSLNVTVPVGVPDTEVVTAAVNVTEAPENEEFALETSVVDVFCCTVSVNTPEVAGRFRASPL